MTGEVNPLKSFSASIVQAVAKGGQSTVMVNARRRFPASGIAYEADLIMTADHVVEQDEGITITLADGGSLEASVAGRDPGKDLAVLRSSAAQLTPAEHLTQDVQVGQVVVALGRPSQEGIEASLGIISAVGGPVRTGRGGLLENYLRTDAIPFPGFSGGPLIDLEGRVVGMNTSGLAHGAAISIPANLVWADAENLVKFGYIKRGYLGVRSQLVQLSPDLQNALTRQQETGLLLVWVENGSPAEAGGLIVGDVLVGVDGHPVADHDELMVGLGGETVGKAISIEVLRGGKPFTVQVKVGERK
jgi:S1-C subfamily serine protease